MGSRSPRKAIKVTPSGKSAQGLLESWAMRRNIETTRATFLQEGRRLLLEQGVPVSINNVRLVDVAKNLGRTTGASYNIWPSQDDFHRDLAIEISREATWSDSSPIHEELGAIFRRGGTVDEILQAAAHRFLNNVASRREYLTFVHFWSVALDEPRVMDAIREGYDHSRAAHGKTFQTLLDAFHLELIPPVTLDDFTVAITALTEGFLLRYSVDPDRVIDRPFGQPSAEAEPEPGPGSQSQQLVNQSLYGHMLSVLFTSMTRPRTEI
jgi:AcrR family transcriptional regulator